MTIVSREVNIYPATKTGSPLVVFNAFENKGAAVHAELEKLMTADFTLATINIHSRLSRKRELPGANMKLHLRNQNEGV